MMEGGEMVKEMVLAYINILMVIDMMVNGERTKKMEMELLFTGVGINIKENG